jgi:hypothetical protein
LRWFNRYVQVVQWLNQIQLDPTQPPAEIGRLVPRTTDEIDDQRRLAYERQLANQDRVNASFELYIRGLEGYRNPFESRAVRLPSGYAVVWASSAGNYLLTDDTQANPNTAARNDWLRLEKDR